MTTRAVSGDDGWTLNGTKMWISNAKWAEFFLTMAKTGDNEITAFLVERGFPGVSISAEEHKMGLKGSSTARLVLEDAKVPAENLLHEPGKGHHVALNALNIGRFKLAAMSLGPAREAIFHASGYAQERKQFGEPISNFGLIQQKFADAAARFFAAESLLYRTGANIDSAFEEFGGTVDGNMKAAREFAAECAAVKVMATEAQAAIVDECLQVYGGYGFTEEFPLPRLYRDSRVTRIYEGTNEINRTFISQAVIRAIQTGAIGSSSAGDSFISELTGKAIKHNANRSVSRGRAV